MFLDHSDLIETFECWELALKSHDTPSVIALSRQGINPVRMKNSSKMSHLLVLMKSSRTGNILI